MKILLYLSLAVASIYSTVGNCAQFQGSTTPAFGTAERKLLYNQDATKRLRQAIYNYDVKAAEKALLEKADPTYDDNGRLYLIFLGTLLQSYASDNPQSQGETVAKTRKLMQLLLDNNADANAKSFNGNTILHAAVLNRDLPLVKFSLKAGTNINAKNNKQETPLMQAVQQMSHPKIIDLLLSSGADTAQADDTETTVLDQLILNTQDYINNRTHSPHIKAILDIFIRYFSQKNDKTTVNTLKEIARELN